MFKTFAQCCKAKGLDPKKSLPVVAGMPKEMQASILATARLYIITAALNGDWVPDWNNSGEYKYFAWWWMNKPGFRLRVVVCGWSSSRAGAGSRLCFRTRELAEHAAKYFKKDYEAMMTIPSKKKPAKKK